MKKISLIIILFYCINISYAQERFFNLYPGWEITHVEEGSSEHLLFGSDTLYSGNSNTPIRIKITENGNFIEYDRYVSDTIYGFSIYSSESYSIHDNYTMASGVYIEYFKNYVLNPVLMFFNNEDYYCDSILDFKNYFNNRLTILRFHREVNNEIHIFGTSLYDEEWNAKTFFRDIRHLNRRFYDEGLHKTIIMRNDTLSGITNTRWWLFNCMRTGYDI
jgi:hypothetical protein